MAKTRSSCRPAISCLRPHDPGQIGVIEAYAQKARDYGLDLELLSANELKARFGFFGPEAIAGSYSPNDGHANPRLAAPAFARAAARAGVDVFENTDIVSIA